MADEPLEVEVGKLVGRLQREKLLELGVREDVAPILRVLEVVLADVGVNLAGHLRAGHHGTLGAGEELGQLVAHEGRLDEAAGGPRATLVLALARLLRGLQVTLHLLLAGLHLGNQGGQLLAHGVQHLKSVAVGTLLLRHDRLGLGVHHRGRRRRGDNSLGLWGNSLLGHYTHNIVFLLSQFSIDIFISIIGVDYKGVLI